MASDEITSAATAVVRSLTGGRWTWPPVRVVDRYPVSSDRIRLAGVPVRTIVSVTRSDTGAAVTDGVLSGTSFLIIPSLAPVVSQGPPAPWDYPGLCSSSSSPLTVEVTYEYGSEPPGLIIRAIDRLAEELELSVEDPDACRLPERVTTVSRQGVSWTLLDPQDFLTNGRTGLYEVDIALSATNRGKAKARARVFSTAYPPPDRRSVTVLSIPVTP